MASLHDRRIARLEAKRKKQLEAEQKAKQVRMLEANVAENLRRIKQGKKAQTISERDLNLPSPRLSAAERRRKARFVPQKRDK